MISAQAIAEAMEAVVGLLRGLQLSPSRMRANLDLTDGLINAEAVMLRLADRLDASRLITLSIKRSTR